MEFSIPQRQKQRDERDERHARREARAMQGSFQDLANRLMHRRSILSPDSDHEEDSLRSQDRTIIQAPTAQQPAPGSRVREVARLLENRLPTPAQNDQREEALNTLYDALRNFKRVHGYWPEMDYNAESSNPGSVRMPPPPLSSSLSRQTAPAASVATTVQQTSAPPPAISQATAQTAPVYSQPAPRYPQPYSQPADTSGWPAPPAPLATAPAAVASTPWNAPPSANFPPRADSTFSSQVNKITVVTMPSAQDVPHFDGHPEQDWRAFIADYELVMRAASMEEEQMARQLPRYLKSDALSVYRTKIERSGYEHDYRYVVSVMGKEFEREAPQRGMSILNIQQRKNQRVGDYKANFEKAVRAAYPGGTDRQTSEFLTQIFIKGLQPKFYNMVTKKDKLKSIAEVTEMVKKKELQDMNMKTVVSAIDEDEHEVGLLTQQVAALLESRKEDASALNNISEELTRLKGLCLEQTKNNQDNQADQGGYRGRGRGNYRGRGGYRGNYRGRGGRGGAGGGSNVCYNCGQPGHYQRNCPEKSKQSEKEEQKPEPEKTVATVNMGGSPKLPTWAYFALICVLSVISADASTIPQPLLCANGAITKPIIWNLPSNIECKAFNYSNKTAPQPVNLTVFSHNNVQWSSKAYQCSKFSISVITRISWLRDIRTMTDPVTTRHTVTKDECWQMVNAKTCSAGELQGSDGIYNTRNHLKVNFDICCQDQEFSVEQCSVVETTVYKRHDEEFFESAAGDVSRCKFEEEVCQLSDGTALVWEVNPEERCAYLVVEDLSGTMTDQHFISDDLEVALTFTEYAIGTVELCDGGNGSASDQGVVVRFNTPIENNHAGLELEPGWEKGDLSFDLSLLQAVSDIAINNTRNSFWKSYKHACHNMVATLQLIRSLLAHHPTSTARHLLQQNAIRAESVADFLLVYPCTPVNDTAYSILPMGDNCTNYVPLEVTLHGITKVMYLDPTDNVLHPTAWHVPCETVHSLVLSLGPNISFYNHSTGTLAPVQGHHQLVYPHIKYQSMAPEFSMQTFSRSHLLEWNKVPPHSVLNDLLATLSRQRKVLETMGIQGYPGTTLRYATRQSSESLFKGSAFSFLWGKRSPSALEAWSISCNILVTVGFVSLLLKCVCQHAGLPQRIHDRFRPASDVNVVVEVDEPKPDEIPLRVAKQAEPKESEAQPKASHPKITFKDDEVAKIRIRPSKSQAPPRIKYHRPNNSQ
jgi:hypothetical protein